MGRLIYPGSLSGYEIDDRMLAHMRVVVMNKLRRGESFMLTVPSQHGTGTVSMWLSPQIALQFEARQPQKAPLNRLWLEILMHSADSIDGLHLIPEPEEGRLKAEGTPPG